MGTFDPIPWHGRVYRHLPVDSHRSPLDPALAARSRENRWNLAGELTMTFASDRALLAEEFHAHLRANRDPELRTLVRPRRIYAIELRLERVFDLTDPAVLAQLQIPDAPGCFADPAIARATAGFLRHARNAQAILVPSLLHLDDPGRWQLVVFLECLPSPLEEIVTLIEPLGTFQIDSPSNRSPSAELALPSQDVPQLGGTLPPILSD